MPDIRGWIRQQRYGGITGLSQTRAQLKIIMLALIPMATILGLAQFSLPEDFKGLSSIMALMGELVVIVFVFMRASINIVKLVPLPSAHTHFPDGQVIPFDFKIEPNGIKFLCDFPDGSKGYDLQFAERYEHQDPKLPYPYVFQSMYLKTFPKTDFDHAIQQVSEAEVFHENMFVTHPRCDFITIYIKEWAEVNGEWVPVAVLGASSYSYAKFLAGEEAELDNTNLKKMTLAYAQRQMQELKEHSDTLEIALEVQREQTGRKHKEQVDKTLGAVRDGVHTIEDTSESWTSRVFNFKTIAKAMIILGLALLFTHFLLGWP